MNFKSILKKPLLTINLVILSLLGTVNSQATIVEFQTNFGSFEVNLYDNATPATVDNFLQYLNSGDYADVVIHRSISDFIIQGGGFFYPGAWPLNNVNSSAAITNEPVYSNVRGTIAMAKVGGQINSATNQWFFNLSNNAADLDSQNGGFTVFGEVIGDGMAIIDAIAALPQYNLGGVTDNIPLQNFTTGNDPDETNLVIISNIVTTDATVDSAAGLNPPATTYVPPPVNNDPDSGGGGGSTPLFLIALLGFALSRKLT